MSNPDAMPLARGLMLVLSSPSGAGKTTIARELLTRETNLELSVSVTTRPPRSEEREGVDYYFVAEEAYHEMVETGQFLEHAQVFNNYYGTPGNKVEAALSGGRDVLFDLDWQGAEQLRQSSFEDMVSVFVLPPSLAELKKRLTLRAQDSDQVVEERMAQAKTELSHFDEYQYVIINSDLEQSISGIADILAAERNKRRHPNEKIPGNAAELKRENQKDLNGFVARMLAA